MESRFEKLVVYQKAINFVGLIYELVKKFPPDERWSLTNQLRRAAISIPLNIAEGSSGTPKDFNRFLGIARGSAFECLAALQISQQQNYITLSEYEKIKEDCLQLIRMLSGLRSKLF